MNVKSLLALLNGRKFATEDEMKAAIKKIFEENSAEFKNFSLNDILINGEKRGYIVFEDKKKRKACHITVE